jgi:hypothetical protein
MSALSISHARKAARVDSFPTALKSGRFSIEPNRMPQPICEPT